MLGTLIRLLIGLAILTLNIALRMAIIIGTLIEWTLSSIASSLTKHRQRELGDVQHPRREVLSARSPEAPPTRDEFTPRPLHRREKRH